MPDSREFPAAAATIREFKANETVFGRYVLCHVLGRGGMDVVWLAFDEQLERKVALKFLPEMIVYDRAALDDLKRETRRSLQLTHPHIVRIHDFVSDSHMASISMEYVDGQTLGNLRSERESKVFEPCELADWVAQICDALDYAHTKVNVVHRDLKPSNLIVSRAGDVKN